MKEEKSRKKRGRGRGRKKEKLIDDAESPLFITTLCKNATHRPLSPPKQPTSPTLFPSPKEKHHDDPRRRKFFSFKTCKEGVLGRERGDEKRAFFLLRWQLELFVCLGFLVFSPPPLRAARLCPPLHGVGAGKKPRRVLQSKSERGRERRAEEKRKRERERFFFF